MQEILGYYGLLNDASFHKRQHFFPFPGRVSSFQRGYALFETELDAELQGDGQTILKRREN